MKKLFLLASTIILVTSCKKNKEEETVCPTPTPVVTPSANEYYKLAVGNYWVYDDYKVDTMGVETFLSTPDSAYVNGTGTFHGNTYYNVVDFYSSGWVRDSSGYIIDTNSVIRFTNQVFNIPLVFAYYNIAYTESMAIRDPVSILVPAGTFSSIDWQLTAHNVDPNYQGDPVRYAHQYYASGTGKVKEVYFYWPTSDHYERRLTRYHVQ